MNPSEPGSSSRPDAAGHLRLATLKRLQRARVEIEAAWRAGAAGPLDAGGLHDPAPEAEAGRLRLLDVRPGNAYLLRHIPGSVSIPAEELSWRTPELPPKWSRFAVVAADAATARRVARELRARGWIGARHVSGTLDHWPGPWQTGPAREMLWEPTPIVREWACRLPAGRVLDLGCGSGRDAVYLAWQGHHVTAVDLLPDALEKAADLARRCGVELALRQMDLRRQRPSAERPYDIVCMVRFLDRTLLEWIPEALAPGGHLLLETYRVAPESEAAEAGPADPGPRRDGLRLAPGEAIRVSAAAGLELRAYQETDDRAGAPIVRLVARKR